MPRRSDPLGDTANPRLVDDQSIDRGTDGRRTGILERLDLPIIQAPMAGELSTPAVVAAVGAAGGLGFLAAGYRTVNRSPRRRGTSPEVTTTLVGVRTPRPGDLGHSCRPVRHALTSFWDSRLPTRFLSSQPGSRSCKSSRRRSTVSVA
jgi:Nitronate monooxygenase